MCLLLAQVPVPTVVYCVLRRLGKRRARETSTGRKLMKATACALLVTATLLSLLSTASWAERKYSAWGPAVPVAAGCNGINSASDDLGPGISKDGLSLYFASNRVAPGAQGGQDIYVAQRSSVH